MSAKTCFHCLEPVPAGFNESVTIQGHAQPMCCIGCKAVAQTIVDQGMTDYYKYRTESAGKVEQLVPEQLALIKSYDQESIQQEFVAHQGDDKEVLLSVEGISCAACAWLIERQLLAHQGVKRVDVNTSTHRAMVVWNDEQVKLSTLITSLAEIGYKSYPFQADSEAAQKQATAKSFIRRLGVAGLMTMQVMMFAFAMYFGMFSGMEDNFEQYFRWISLTLATPVIFYSALPFLTNAISGLRAKQLNMDVPVSLAIFGAYFASCYATLSEQGEVYFESICMFTFLLLLGKYLEFRARLKASEFTANLQKLLPLTARKVENNEEHITSAKLLSLGDIVRVKAGETIAADGVVIAGHSSVDESMMTGEHHPVTKRVGDQVHAGTLNHDGVLTIEINKVGQNTLVNQIIRLQHSALSQRPRIAQVTDKVAQWFVACLLVFASITAVAWYSIAPEHAFWITIAVLVATCPCALSLAIPTALTCAVANLTKRGVLIKQSHVLETATKLTKVGFDKTGTLTLGRFVIDHTEILDNAYDEQQIHTLASALEAYSEHPIAKAFTESASAAAQQVITDAQVHTGYGVAGIWQGQRVHIGKASWFAGPQPKNAQAVLYVNESAVAAFFLQDKVREYAQELQQELKQQGIERVMLTGDPSDKGAQLSQQLQLDACHSALLPQDKLALMQSWHNQGDICAMVGDGVNDSPVFNAAHLSIAMDSGADISKNTADVVLLNSDLRSVSKLITIAKKTRRIVRQNLALSLCYNGAILPLAAMGLVAPWMAVIGMSASSIIVITNSLRLLRL
ncbi:heavy metal translocating P-type ATPase [Pseudoalteromonas sp. SW0106-04]|uniref:heavy metal translocating P-type ATPase n=1 Tax=Pseudoalteromonas sp. SW0106-04 TaxID=1702169 RepID=UPI0006B42756|nr:heavy metal translocating P-type ATPase [Pseudoalteromonas sp. SW0106-04]